MDASGPRPRRFNALPATECTARLQSGKIGRVAWNTTEGPLVLPVTYVYRDGHIVFRTTPYGVLAELRNVRQVAFEVDDFDVVSRTGWSVLAQGWAKAAVNPDELSALWNEPEPVPWAAGNRTLFITITPDQVSGREIIG